VSHAKMAEPIEMPFVMLSGVDPRKHELDGYMSHVQGVAHREVLGPSAASCAKMADPI